MPTRIYDRCREVLRDTSARGLMRRFNVKAVCTTDDPCDDLHWHEVIADDSTMDNKVLPAFHPDKAIAIESPSSARISPVWAALPAAR